MSSRSRLVSLSISTLMSFGCAAPLEASRAETPNAPEVAAPASQPSPPPPPSLPAAPASDGKPIAAQASASASPAPPPVAALPPVPPEPGAAKGVVVRVPVSDDALRALKELPSDVVFFTSRRHPIGDLRHIHATGTEVGMWGMELLQGVSQVLEAGGVTVGGDKGLARVIGDAYFAKLFRTEGDLRLFATHAYDDGRERSIGTSGGGVRVEFAPFGAAAASDAGSGAVPGGGTTLVETGSCGKKPGGRSMSRWTFRSVKVIESNFPAELSGAAERVPADRKWSAAPKPVVVRLELAQSAKGLAQTREFEKQVAQETAQTGKTFQPLQIVFNGDDFGVTFKQADGQVLHPAALREGTEPWLFADADKSDASKSRLTSLALAAKDGCWVVSLLFFPPGGEKSDFVFLDEDQHQAALAAIGRK